MKTQRRRILTLTALLTLLACVCLASGCGTITRMVADRIAVDTVKRVATVETKVEKLATKIETIAEEVEARVTEAVKTPIVGIIVTLILGAGLAVLAAFKIPTLVDEIIIGTVALAGVILVWAYRGPILWTALAAAIGLAAWKLGRKYILPAVTNGATPTAEPPVNPPNGAD